MGNNIEQLRPSPEEARRRGRLGGLKKAENTRLRRTFRDALSWYLSMDFTPNTNKDFELKQRFPTLTNQDRMAISMVEAATQDKDVRAFVAIRDTVGEQPQTRVAVEQERPFTISIKTVE